MGVHGPREEESSIVRRVELVAEDVYGGNPLDVVLCAQVGGQETSELHQRVVTLRGYKQLGEMCRSWHVQMLKLLRKGESDELWLPTWS